MGKTKKVGIIARTLTCLMATAAIALSTASPAFAASEVTDSVDTSNISVTVPATIPCTMMADGTVVAPSGLTIVNSGDAVVLDAYTADAMGNAVDYIYDYIPSGNGSVFRALALDFSGFDTSNVTNMRGMFRDNHAVESLDLSGFDTSSVTDMSFMFHNMTRIQSLDVRSFDTSRVVNMEYMFKGLGSVLDKFKSLDLSSFDTSNVTNMKGMFDNNVCLELVTLGSRFRFITWGDGAGYLPRQTPDYIPGADGMWYNTAGQGFNPNVVPSYVADTYTAYNPALQRPVSLSESPV
ncbi:TPA: BspA family leucine-rich repeat surface protein [Streptococcus agalactiae]